MFVKVLVVVDVVVTRVPLGVHRRRLDTLATALMGSCRLDRGQQVLRFKS